MRRKAKRKVWICAGILGFIIVWLTTAMITVVLYKEFKNCNVEREQLQLQLQTYQKEVYTAAEKLTKGTVITEEKVNREIRYSDEAEERFMTEVQLGMAITMDVPAGTCLTKDMLCEKNENYRIVFLEEAEVAETIENGARIDMRIRYCNAEDYIVLSDKVIVKSKSGSGILLELTEAEILLISSAIADCELYQGTKLYAVEYPNYRQTDSGLVNYVANKEVLTLLGREKKEGESRIALEQRLKQEKP